MKRTSITNHNLSTMCRLCLSSGDTVIDIFMFSNRFKHQVADVIMKVAPVQITRCDELPNFICQLCYTQLETSHQFQMQILQSEKTLQHYLQQLHTSDKLIKPECSNQRPFDDHFIHNITPDITVKCEYLKLPDVPTNYNPANKISEEMSLKSEIKHEPLDDNLLSSTESANNTVDKFFESVNIEMSSKNTKIDINYTLENFECLRSADVTKYLDKCKGQTGNTPINHAKNRTKKINLNRRNICNASFDIPPNLQKKKPKQTDDKPHQCDVCNANFNNSSNLKRHQRIHTGEKPHQCDVCNVSFQESSDLKRHQHTHTGEKPYQCDLCNKCFIQQGILNIHKRTHTGEKLYRCDLCDKSFSASGTLTRHQRIHTGEKPFQCDVCNMSFKELYDLKRHQRIHTGEKPHQCDVCKKCFSESGHLNVHKRTHTGEKPYKCDLCSKCFTISSHLNVHKRTHTGEKPYQCDICNKRFSHSRGLRTHKLQHL